MDINEDGEDFGIIKPDIPQDENKTLPTTIVEQTLPKEDINLGPYNKGQYDDLEFIQGIRKSLIQDATAGGLKMPRNPEQIQALLSVMKDMSGDIHKIANTVSKHDIGTANVASKEEMAEFLQLVHLDAQKARTKNNRNIELDDEFIPKNIVPGQTELDIIKPELKEILNTPEEDEE